MFENQARADRYNILKALFACKLVEGSSVSPHMIKMIGHIETMDKLSYELKDDLANDVILQSHPTSYEPFIMKFHRNGMEKTVAELHEMLNPPPPPQSCDDGSKREEKEEALDASQGQRKGKDFR
jgi:hypothetical protein